VRISPISSRYSSVPIQFFNLQGAAKTKSIKTSSKASKSSNSSRSKKCDAFESVDSVIDPADFAEDPDTMQSLWGDVDHFFEKGDIKEGPLLDFKSILVDAEWILKSYRNDIRNQGQWFQDTKIPLHHVTIYEAIIYDALIHHRWQDIPNRVTVRPIIQYYQNKIVFLMELHHDNTVIDYYQIRYDFMAHKSVITDRKNQKIGQFDIIVRQHRLEEIQGELYGLPLVLDPIWADDFTVKSETLRFGGAKAEVFKSRQSTQVSLLDQQGRRVPFSMKNVHSVFLKKGVFLTRKTVRVGQFQLSLNQLFLMRLLMPFRFNVTITSI
jgi:hypothetical protein